MAFIIFFFIQLIFIIYFTRCLPARGLGLYSIFYLIFSLLIVLPFFLIALHAIGWIDHQAIFGKVPDANISLELGNGTKPLLVLMLFQACYLAGGHIHLVRRRSDFDIGEGADVLPVSKYLVCFAVLLAIGSLAYVLLRFVYLPDFPLFRMFQDGSGNLGPRDLAYNYGVRTDVPYFFRPSIHSQFYRIALPLSAFIVAHALINSANMRQPWMYALLAILVLLAILLNVGTFKRSPILYILLWGFCYFYMYASSRKLFHLGGFLVAAILISLVISTFYLETDLVFVLKSLGRRLLVVEAVGEFVAIEHFGKSFDYLGLDIVQRYISKLAGQDAQTFSEYWKIASGGTRGYTSVGIMSELFISISYFSVVIYLLIGFGMSAIDLRMYKFRNTDYRPFIAGLIVVISFASVKGLLSQFFTGGIFSLLVLTLFYALSRDRFERAMRSP